MTKRMAPKPSPDLQQCIAHLARIEKPKLWLSKVETAELLAMLENCSHTPKRRINPVLKAVNTTHDTSLAPCTLRPNPIDGKRPNESNTAKICETRAHHVVTPTRHVKPSATILNTMQDIVERLQVVVKDLKEYKADMASRSVEIRPTLQLTTPSVVLPPPSLTWVPSPPPPAPTLLVLPPGLASPAVPPIPHQQLPLLPPSTEFSPSPHPIPKPDLGPVVHTIVPVTTKKAPPPHPLSPSTTGVVLFSLLLLHHQGSHHWLGISQPGSLDPLGNCPDPEPPPGLSLVH
jgi:hypothetical protein